MEREEDKEGGTERMREGERKKERKRDKGKRESAKEVVRWREKKIKREGLRG